MSSPASPSAPAGYPPLRRVGDFLFAWRNLIFSAVTILFLAALPPRPFGGGAAMDRILDLVGVGITVFGQALRMAVIGFAYIKRGGTEGKVDAQRLVTEGFFNHCRNPLYVGNILIVAGLVVVHNNLIAYLLIPLACFGYSAIFTMHFVGMAAIEVTLPNGSVTELGFSLPVILFSIPCVVAGAER